MPRSAPRHRLLRASQGDRNLSSPLPGHRSESRLGELGDSLRHDEVSRYVVSRRTPTCSSLLTRYKTDLLGLPPARHLQRDLDLEFLLPIVLATVIGAELTFELPLENAPGLIVSANNSQDGFVPRGAPFHHSSRFNDTGIYLDADRTS